MRCCVARAGIVVVLWLACAALLPACFSVHVQTDTGNSASKDAGNPTSSNAGRTSVNPIDSGAAFGKPVASAPSCAGICPANTSMTGPPPPNCDARTQMASEETNKALAATNTSCMVDSDCAEVSTRTSCFSSCRDEIVISAATAPALLKELARIEHDVCGSFTADGCIQGLPPCPPQPAAPTMPACKSGQCTSVPASARGPTMCPGCLSETISWGSNGGDVAYSDQSKLAPCVHYSRVRTPSGGSGASSLSCETDLMACNSSASVGAVETALANEDVKLARTGKSPVLYGRDTRSVDGTVFEITLGPQVIDVGDACNGQAGCTDVPAGIQRLVDELMAVDMQLQAQPACQVFDPKAQSGH
jgi:hypothetical protein